MKTPSSASRWGLHQFKQLPRLGAKLGRLAKALWRATCPPQNTPASWPKDTARTDGWSPWRRLRWRWWAAYQDWARPQVRLTPQENRTARQVMGAEGERLAKSFLRAKGFHLREQNYRAGHDEIDLICQDGPELVFIEVRTRGDTSLSDGEFSVDFAKRAKLHRAMDAYLRSHGADFRHAFRLDVIGISIFHDGTYEIRHFERCALGKTRGHTLQNWSPSRHRRPH